MSEDAHFSGAYVDSEIHQLHLAIHTRLIQEHQADKEIINDDDITNLKIDLGLIPTYNHG